jgi:hypothetical protein
MEILFIVRLVVVTSRGMMSRLSPPSLATPPRCRYRTVIIDMIGLQGLQCLLLCNLRAPFRPDLSLALAVGIPGLLEDAKKVFALVYESIMCRARWMTSNYSPCSPPSQICQQQIQYEVSWPPWSLAGCEG